MNRDDLAADLVGAGVDYDIGYSVADRLIALGWGKFPPAGSGYSLAEVRSGTGFPPGIRFIPVPGD